MAAVSVDEILRTALSHHQAGQLAEAERLYRAVLARDSNQVDALQLLGVLAGQVGHPRDGTELLRRAIAMRPDVAVFHNNLGNLLFDLNEFDSAAAAFERAIALQPAYAEAHLNFGNVLRRAGRLDDAVNSFQTAAKLDPSSAAAAMSLGVALKDLGRLDQAESALDRAVALAPQLAEARWARAILLLLRGKFAEGWREAEWRWRWAGFQSPRRNFSQPLWDGTPLAGKSILLYAEQGLGDAIQFARLIPQVAQRGGHVILEVPAPLRRLLEHFPGTEKVIALGEPLPAFDTQCPLLTLPLALGITQENIPNARGYLAAAADAIAAWRERIAALSGLKIGLVWAGQPQHANDHNRSIPGEMLAPLAEMSGASFISLQFGPAGKMAPPQLNLADFTSEIADFAGTAALVANLDLVITVDTSVAHLAGAMGKEVWIMLPFSPDWRWLRDRSDSPWYASAKLFRQSTPGDWAGVLRAVAAALREQIHST